MADKDKIKKLEESDMDKVVGGIAAPNPGGDVSEEVPEEEVAVRKIRQPSVRGIKTTH